MKNRYLPKAINIIADLYSSNEYISPDVRTAKLITSELYKHFEYVPHENNSERWFVNSLEIFRIAMSSVQNDVDVRNLIIKFIDTIFECAERFDYPIVEYERCILCNVKRLMCPIEDDLHTSDTTSVKSKTLPTGKKTIIVRATIAMNGEAFLGMNKVAEFDREISQSEFELIVVKHLQDIYSGWWFHPTKNECKISQDEVWYSCGGMSYNFKKFVL